MSRLSLVFLLLGGCALPPVFVLGATPSVSGPRLVVHAPWVEGMTIVEAAGGSPIGPLVAPMGLLAVADNEDGFDERLRVAGAWAVLDGAAIARLCGVSKSEWRKGI